jgi:hypothetical protein
MHKIRLSVLLDDKFKNLVFDHLAVVIMNVIGQIRDPSMKIQIQVGNAVWLLRPCSMFLLRTEPSSGKLNMYSSNYLMHF